MNWVLVICAYTCAALIVGGQWVWKIGLSSEGQGASFLDPIYWLKLLRSPWILSGILFYLVAAVFFMYLLREYRLGLVYPLVISIVLLNSAIVAKFFLAEPLTIQNVFGLILIVGAVFLLTGS